MRIVSVKLKNFASYETLEFDFQNQGLTLIQGPTGAGKSTFCDVIPYILFGTTAKNGPVSDVLSWHGGVTEGTIYLDDGTEITRRRGAKDNDLYFTTDDEELGTRSLIRGRDTTDTQRLIHQRLGFTVETYLAGAYLHEFSQTAQFFTTTAKNRRIICEQLVDLSFPKNLHEKTNIMKKSKEKELAELQKNQYKLQLGVDYLTSAIQTVDKQAQEWSRRKETKLIDLQAKSESFVEDQARRLKDLYKKEYSLLVKIDKADLQEEQQNLIEEILSLPSDVCKECGSQTYGEKLHELETRLAHNAVDIRDNETHKISLKELQATIHDCKTSTNLYSVQLQELIDEINPYTSKDSYGKLEKLEEEIESTVGTITDIQSYITDLELLSDVTNTLRNELITNVIGQIENSTNSFLTKHFDAEIRVVFYAGDADKLEISITKDGNECSFTQLSKGQRCLLKLCFGISVMEAIGNHHGVQFDQIFLDEALSGLDANMKTKAFSMFSALSTEHNSVFVVDHSTELKALFSNELVVELIDGKSVIRNS